MTHEATDVQILHIDDVEPVEVVPGIMRRRLPATDWARGWMYDFAPGTEWPETDVHDCEERYYVVSGEFIDRGRRLRTGSYVVFAPGSTHRPRTETGARMLGISILGATPAQFRILDPFDRPSYGLGRNNRAERPPCSNDCSCC